MALHGSSVKSFIAGAKNMDSLTRIASPNNPAMLMALAWYVATDGVGKKDMVVIPYKDRLLHFSRYLQQIVMESIGKEKDRAGNVVQQGLTVYGNKGSTDQHSFVQQLRDGLQNFFVTIIGVLKAREGKSIPVDADGMTSGDYLNGFSLGTMKALAEKGNPIIHLSIDEFSERELGALIALYERAVGFYGSLININAYHQPGVEAGKKAATEILKIQRLIRTFLFAHGGKNFSAVEVADGINLQRDKPLVFKLLEHMAKNDDSIDKTRETNALESRYGRSPNRSN
jgi:glucose-6-phosphate isomerase